MTPKNTISNSPCKKPPPDDQPDMTDLAFLLTSLDKEEQIARLRELRALVAVYCGWDHPAKRAFDAAVQSPDPVRGPSDELCSAALAEISKLPALTRRRLLSSYGALNTKDF
jgi:hypothetical protein